MKSAFTPSRNTGRSVPNEMDGGGLSGTTSVSSSVTGSAGAGPVADTLSAHISARKSDMRILYGKLLYLIIGRLTSGKAEQRLYTVSCVGAIIFFLRYCPSVISPLLTREFKECELLCKPTAELHDMLPSRNPVPTQRSAPAFIGFQIIKNAPCVVGSHLTVFSVAPLLIFIHVSE